HDRHVGAGRLGAGDLAGGYPEGAVVVERADLAVGQPGRVVQQVGVLVELVVVVRGSGTEGLERQDVDEGGVAVLARRQDVVALAQAVVVVPGVPAGSRRWGQRQGEADGGAGDQRDQDACDASRHGWTLPSGLRREYRSDTGS